MRCCRVAVGSGWLVTPGKESRVRGQRIERVHRLVDALTGWLRTWLRLIKPPAAFAAAFEAMVANVWSAQWPIIDDVGERLEGELVRGSEDLGEAPRPKYCRLNYVKLGGR